MCPHVWEQPTVQVQNPPYGPPVILSSTTYTSFISSALVACDGLHCAFRTINVSDSTFSYTSTE
ncbi:hypothetical protein DPMN_069760 [Dreissena polymorpha]|uniref:Uncharacterized protein n=1 Tax=Dreissena polymorpha TaxID=45954 RepID=A0A9D4BUM2_DREPO|nr:hypothetical protein DPMN_069760 [Dreissena polymorpha]